MDYINDIASRGRRHLLRGTAIMVGGLVIAPAYVTAKERERRLGTAGSQVFSASQKPLLRALCDTILPETETPGALGARVDDFIADTLELWCTAGERQAFLDGLDALARDCRTTRGAEFTRLAPADRLTYLVPLDEAAVAARAQHVEPLPFFATLKELTLIGYYTSETGCKAIGYFGPTGSVPGPDGPLDSAVWI